MPEDTKKDNWDLLDHKAIDTIRLMLFWSITFNVKNKITTTLHMEALSNLYELLFATNKVHLLKKLILLHVLENRSFQVDLNKFKEVVD